MLYSLKYFLGVPLVSGLEDCGHCEDFIIDVDTWQVRYVAGSDGGFFFKRSFLLPCERVDRGELESCVRGIPLTVGKEQVGSGPAARVPDSVTAEMEAEVRAHYHLPVRGERAAEAADGSVASVSETRSFRSFLDFSVASESSPLGRVVDLIVNVSDFSIPYLAIDTKPSHEGGVRLVSTDQNEGLLNLDWPNRQLNSSLSVYHLIESPSADLSDGRLTLGDQRKLGATAF